MARRAPVTPIILSAKNIGLALAAALLLVLAAFLSGSADRAAFRSSEYAFTDSSVQGLAIAPASCPSNPHYAGECSTSTSGGGGTPPTTSACTNRTYCVASSVYFQDAAASCTVSFVALCPYGCVDGRCVNAPGLNFRTFSATWNNAAAQGGEPTAFTATGHLQVKPSLISAGSRARVYWQVDNVTSCVVRGTNGDVWTDTESGSAFSGAMGQQTSPITQSTTYTMDCVGIDESHPHEEVTVSIAPTFQEI